MRSLIQRLALLCVLLLVGACGSESGNEQPGETIPVAGGGVVGTGGTVSSRAVALAPKGLLQTSASPSSVGVTWQDEATNELIYEVEFCAGEGCEDFAPAANSPLAANATTVTIDGLAPAATYAVRVRATNRNGNSAWVLLASAATLNAPSGEITLQSVSLTSVTIAWTPSASPHESTEIERCIGAGCSDFRPVFGSPFVASASHLESGLSPGMTYRMRVRSRSRVSASAWSESADITTLAAAAAPTGLSASLSDTTVSLSWVDASTTELFYEIERCSGSGCSTFAAASGSPLGANAVSYNATALVPSTDYTWRVRATGAEGSSAWVSTSGLRTAPAAPTSLTAAPSSSASVALAWSESASDETGFAVERCPGAGCTSFAPIAGSPFASGATSAAVNGLIGGMTYRFRVRAIRGDVTSSWLTSSDTTTLASAAECDSPTTAVIDRGSKGLTTAVGRGLWSAVATIPTSEAPAIAYYDGSATGGTASIKLSWWNGSSFQVESIAGDARVAAGSASYLAMAFLPDGKPVVAWATGSTTVKIAVRSAPLGASGAWSAGVVDTVAGAASRALEIAVSPLGQVGLIYLTNTTTAGRARFIYCASGCDSLVNYVAMSASTDTIEASNVVAAYQGTGIGWCKHNASTYYPAVTYPGNAGAAVRYSSCLGALSTCRTATGWNGQTASVVTTAGAIAKLHLDPTVTGDNPKILARNAANNALQAFQMNQACNAAGPYTFTAGNTLGAATSGTAWASLLKSGSGWHVLTNLAATNVHYHTSATTNFATTTWHAAGVLDTLTLPAVSAGGGGAAVDRTRGIIYSSYGSAAAPFTQFLGVVNDASVASNAASAVFQTHLPDLGGGVALPLATGQTRNVAAAESSAGRIGVAYVDHSIGAAAGALLKYAYRGATGGWTVQVVPGTNTPQAPSLAFDHLNRPWVGFYDAATFRYYLTTNPLTDGSGEWVAYQFPINLKTANATAPATDETAVAMYYEAGVTKPVMLVLNSTGAGGTGVRAAQLNPSTGVFVSFEVVDALAGSFGTRLTADFDRAGRIVTAVYDLTTTRVRYSHSTDGRTFLPSTPQVTTAPLGREGLDITIDPTTSRPAITFYDRSANSVHIGTCTSTFADCSSGGNWSTATVATSIGVSGIAVANEKHLNTSLTYSAEGVPYVSYMTGIASSAQALAVSDKETGTFVPTAIASASPSAVSGAAAVNFAMTGLHLDAIRTGNGSLVTTYIGPNNWLYATSCEP